MARCKSPDTLDVRFFENEGQLPRANFICWSPPDRKGEPSGRWLGNLPLTRNDPTFLQPFASSPDGTSSAIPPDRLQQARFNRSTLNGELFFVPTGKAIDIRRGYFATIFLIRTMTGIPIMNLLPVWTYRSIRYR
jgi:hypothetical protein